MTPRTALVVGGGVLGSACAHQLDRQGWSVTLIDAGGTPSASVVAAGMLAPAFESVLDGADAARVALLRHARELWPAVSPHVVLHREGASWVGENPDEVLAALLTLGFNAREASGGVFTPDDWRLDPRRALQALSRNVKRITGRVEAVRPGGAHTAEGWLAADLVVLASGAQAVTAPEAEPALRAVTPVRGQIVGLAGVSPPHVLRGPGAYLAPTAGGVLVGASMEPGVRSLTPDRAVTQRLLQAGARMWPALGRGSRAEVFVGVRGASPDGLPLAGPVAPGLSVALAPRRNGWLLAPLVATIVAAYAAGDDPGPFAAAFHPLRF